MTEIVERQRSLMLQKGLDAMVAISPENIAYTAGFYVPSQSTIRSRHAMCVITANGPDVMISVDMEAGYVRSRSPFPDVRQYQEFKDNPMDLLASVLRELGLEKGRIGMELDYLPARDYLNLLKQLPLVTWVESEMLYFDLRMIKTQQEIEALRIAGKVAERTHHAAFSQLHPGMSERDLLRFVINEIYSTGVDKISTIIIGSGERSGFPNCTATDRIISKGDLVRMDILAINNNYQSDCARTAVVGNPNPEQQKYWQMMVDTHKAVLDLVKPGVHTDVLYEKYCRKFTEYQLPIANFLGHGLGLTAHEYPYIGIRGGAILQENMVLCVEPFWFGSDVGMGYQLEDEILITKDGYELITNYAPTDQMIIVS